jgi:Peptidase family S41
MSRLPSLVRPMVLSFALLATHAGGLRAQADTAWSALYRADLDAARDFIAANHPGMADTLNPGFARAMERAYAEALAAADSVTTYSAYAIALRRFGNRFQDEHLSITTERALEGVREAGVYPVFQGGAFVVREVDARYGDAGRRLVGATLAACDARAADEVFRERVLSWRGREEIESDWFELAPLLLVDYGPPTPPAPAACSLRADGGMVELPLRWAPTTGREAYARMQRLTAFDDRSLSLERLDGGHVVWVNVPTFSVHGDTQIAAMRGLIDSLRAEMAQRRWRLLVFDLRGNAGGGSAWGDQMAAAVFGEAWAEAANEWLGDGVYTEWRVSPFNLEAVRGIVRQLEERHGAQSEEAVEVRELADSLSAALERGEALFGEPEPREGVPPPPPVELPGRVVAVTSASCFSACLDFLDVLRLHPAVVQVGQPTGVDTNYMENWAGRLPSGLARINYPLKVYRNRRRANNEGYAPHIRYEGALNDTAALRAWILERYGR